MSTFMRRLRQLALTAVVLVLLLSLVAFAAALAVDPESWASNLAQKVSEPQSRFVSVPFTEDETVEIHYLEQHRNDAGNRAFLLLHGFTFNAFTWQRQLAALAGHGRAIAIDQLPYGLSTKALPAATGTVNPYDREAAADLVLATMDALGIANATLIGNSSGSTLALEVALRAPHRVEALVLVAPWVYVRRPVIPRWLSESLPFRRLSLFIARALGERGGLLDVSYAQPERITPERRRLADLHLQTRNWDLAWAAMINRSLSTPIRIHERLRQVHRPTLVIAGDKDGVVSPADSARVAKSLPNGDYIDLPGCGHVPHEECPVAFAAAVAAWLVEHEGADDAAR